jgi:hypothetical protein
MPVRWSSHAVMRAQAHVFASGDSTIAPSISLLDVKAAR